MNKEKIKKLESISLRLVWNFIFKEMTEEERVNFSTISITWIKISRDLSYLDIFVSSFKNWDILPKALAKHWYYIQKRLNKALEIRKIPKIRFRYDSSWKKAESLTIKINNLK